MYVKTMDKTVGKRADINRKELKKRLVESARAIIEEDGFSGLSVRKVTAMTGCSLGAVYNVFENLDELMLYVNAITLDELVGRLRSISETSEPGEEMAMKFSECYISFSSERFPLWSALFEHRMSADLPDWFEEKISDAFKEIEYAIAPLTSDDKNEPSMSAKVLWAGLHGICSLSITGKLDTVGATTANNLARTLIKNYINGLKK